MGPLIQEPRNVRLGQHAREKSHFFTRRPGSSAERHRMPLSRSRWWGERPREPFPACFPQRGFARQPSGCRRKQQQRRAATLGTKRKGISTLKALADSIYPLPAPGSPLLAPRSTLLAFLPPPHQVLRLPSLQSPRLSPQFQIFNFQFSICNPAPF